MYRNAVATAAEDGKDFLSLDIYRDSINSCIRGGLLSDASEILMKYALACSRSGALNAQCKAYLAAVVVLLYQGDVRAAWEAYQNAMTVDDFAKSDEAFATDDLFQAYAYGHPEGILELVKAKVCFQYMETAVAQLARKLPCGNFPEQARFVADQLGVGAEDMYGGVAAGLDPDLDDLT